MTVDETWRDGTGPDGSAVRRPGPRRGTNRSGRAVLTVLAAALMAVALGVLAPVGPLATSASADDGDLRPRLEAACARVATATERLDRATARLDAPASERGSLAWFAAAIARATDNNRPRIAAELQERFDRLTARRAQLDVRAAQLDRFAARCAELGAGA